MGSKKLTKEQKEKLKLMTPEFRASHPHVFKPSQMINEKGKPQGEPNYSIEMLFDKKTTKLSEIQRPCFQAAAYEWGKKENWPEGLKFPWRDGDKPYGKKREVKKEHKGMWVVRASSSAEFSKPHVVGKNPKQALENESQFYPGCYARAAIMAHSYTFADKDGVKFVLDGVQFIRDGEAIGGKKPADQVFGMLEGDDGDYNEDDFNTEDTDIEESDMDEEESFF